MSGHQQIIFIVGPTAIGKSDVAFYLAEKIDGEIISCDSMQVYQEIDIASNKPSSDMLREVPHHLINVVSVEQRFDVAQFNELANQAVQQIKARNKVPIIVGGSGLYVEILLDGIFHQGESDQKLRQQIEQEIEEKV
jgi:tRNA dimethylallyltransferase